MPSHGRQSSVVMKHKPYKLQYNDIKIDVNDVSRVNRM